MKHIELVIHIGQFLVITLVVKKVEGSGVMRDKDPRDCHKTLETLQPSFVMPELDISHSSWLGKSLSL